MQFEIKRPEALLKDLKESLLKAGSSEINALIDALEARISEWVLKEGGNIYNTRNNRIYTPEEVVGLLNDKVSYTYNYEHTPKRRLTADDFLKDWVDSDEKETVSAPSESLNRFLESSPIKINSSLKLEDISYNEEGEVILLDVGLEKW